MTTAAATTPTQLKRNLTMPYMKFNWAMHDTWCNSMTFEERGVYDAARSSLWTVEGCTMPLETLRFHLKIKPGSRIDKVLFGLISRGSLSISDGNVFDSVQVNEFSQAVSKGKVNKLNGLKGGRPKGSVAPLQRENGSSKVTLGADSHDF